MSIGIDKSFWFFIRFVVPISALVFIGYFAFRYKQLGEPAGRAVQGPMQTIGKIWTELIYVVRKSFKTIVLTIIVFTILSVGSIIAYTSYSKKSVTEKQLARMSQAIAKHKNQLGNYPVDLAELVGNDPLKREWFKDSWGNKVDYAVTKNGKGFQLTSPGADGVMGNGDDLVSSI